MLPGITCGLDRNLGKWGVFVAVVDIFFMLLEIVHNAEEISGRDEKSSIKKLLKSLKVFQNMHLILCF